MRVIKPGERYELYTAEGVPVIELIFCKTENGKFVDGLTNEEILEVLINRMSHLVKIKPTTENMNTLLHLNQVKNWMNVRNFKKLNNQREYDNGRKGISVQAKSG